MAAKTFSLASIAATTTPAPLSATDLCVYSVQVQADPGNGVVNIIVGDSEITDARGVALTAGAFWQQSGADSPNTMRHLNLKDIYVRTASGTGSVRVLYMLERP